MMYEMGDEDSLSFSDHEELIHMEESEGSSDCEEQTVTCSAKDSPDVNPKDVTSVTVESKGANLMDLCFTGVALTLSSTALMILYPVYIEKTGATPVTFLFPSTFCLLTLLLVTQILNKMGKIQGLLISQCPFPSRRLYEVVLSYGAGCLMVTFAQVDGRVPCHLQDPLKAVIVILSLLYYFFLCKKMLGLRKLFAASVMAVGLFIAADYGLCDQFKCRGAESRVESSWQSRVGWTIVYLIGLGLFTLHFALTEEHVIQRPAGALYVSLSGSLLATVSRIVSREEAGDELYRRSVDLSVTSSIPMDSNEHICLSNIREKNKKSSIVIVLWIQASAWLLMITVGILYMVGSMARGTEANEIFWNKTFQGFACHIPEWSNRDNVRHLVNTLPAAAMAVPDYPNESESIKINAIKESEVDFGNDKIKLNKRRLLEHTDITTPFSYYDSELKKYDNDENSSNENQMNQELHLKKKSNNKNTQDLNIESKNGQLNNKSENVTNDAPISQLNSTIIIGHNEKNITISKNENLTREKRNSDDQLTNSLGFKIIRPTDSILQGHVITTKLKPGLVGHVILNKTRIIINGHEITHKQDFFIREHDPSTTKVHRQHRGRLDMRFVTTINSTVNNNTARHRYIRQSPFKSNENEKGSNKGVTIKLQYGQKRYKRNAETKLYNDTVDVENFFKNIKAFEKNLIQKNKENHHIKINNEDFVKYDKKENSLVDINDNPESKQKVMNYAQTNVVYTITKLETEECGYLYIYGWSVFISYTIFSISSIRFMILCQSSVFTIAMMSPALPLSGVWWAIFSQNQDGSLTIQPGLSGELICALLGLPIVTLGLILLFKAHLIQPGCDHNHDDQIGYARAVSSMSTIKLCTNDVMTYELTNGSSLQSQA